MNEITTSAAYNRALAEHTRAGAIFQQVRDDYRAGRCGARSPGRRLTGVLSTC